MVGVRETKSAEGARAAAGAASSLFTFEENYMQIIDRKISELTPYEKNPRNNDNAVEAVAESIKEFGFKNPIIVDKAGVIVCGHTRYKAAKRLGLEKVPTIVADDLTEEQIAAFRLADNRLAELATWNMKELGEELENILAIDMERFGFDIVETFEDEDNGREFGDERLRTDNEYNLRWNDTEDTDGWFQIPIIRADNTIPTDLIGFNYVLSDDEPRGGVHFFIDDYQFERIWNSPENYIEKLRGYECVLSPNFSLYMDMPRAMKIWNTYRSRLIGQIMQKSGLHVIPTICWAERETYDFAYAGVEKNATVAVSTIGCKQDKEAEGIWRDGCAEMLRRLTPRAVLLYGGRIEDFDFGSASVYEFGNHVTDRMKEQRGKHGR